MGDWCLKEIGDIDTNGNKNISKEDASKKMSQMSMTKLISKPSNH